MAEADSQHTKPPRVSLGVPVYNGERYLRDALDSMIAQTFEDFEVIISDNASTDDTWEICEEYARRDARIQCHRSETNRGAAWNFNRAFELARGEYFKWAAHDDLCAPTLLERCVEALDTHPDAVLCDTGATIIDESGEVMGHYDVTFATDSPRPHVRYSSLLLKDNKAHQVFGLIRREGLAKTPLIGSYFMSDEVLLTHLALQGTFHRVAERLFLSREHRGQSIQLFNDPIAYNAWFDPQNTGRDQSPYWNLLKEYRRAISASRIGFVDRMRCHVGWLKLAMRSRGYLGRSALYRIGSMLGLSTRPVSAAWRRR